ncbi:MAG: ADOP family duplicated permease [Vicinamibacterales bacterium]
MVTLVKDLRHGARLLLANPGFSLAAVVTLSLAVGANTVIFSFANILVLKPLPITAPERLAWLRSSSPRGEDEPFALAEYDDFRDGVPAIEGLAGRRSHAYTMRRPGEDAERVFAYDIVGDLHHLWGLGAFRGRVLGADDERPGAAPVVVLSHRYWLRRFGASDAVVGRSVLLDGREVTVVGVLTPTIEIGNLAEVELWVPNRTVPSTVSRAEREWRLVGRLTPGATLAQASAQAEAVASRLEREHPDTNQRWHARAISTRESIAGRDTYIIMGLLLAVVGLLLLLACANVMNLLLSRLLGRRQELAVRTALGATRGRVARQIVTESLLLGLSGGALGLLVGWAGLHGVKAAATEPFFELLSVDRNVLLFACLLAFVAPVLFATLPAWRILGDDIRETLGDGGTRSVGGHIARHRSALVVVQVSLAVTLLVVAGLIVRTLVNLNRIDPGFRTTGLLTWQLELPEWKFPAADVPRLRDRLFVELSRLPNVDGFATVSSIPTLQRDPSAGFDIGGRIAAASDEKPWACISTASADYFRVMAIPVVAGRGFETTDTSDSQPVVVVNREAARRYWGGPDAALGSSIALADGAPGHTATVVGIVGDTANPDAERMPEPYVYLVDEQRPMRRFSVVLRANQPERAADAVRAAVRAVDDDVAVFRLRTVDDAIRDDRSSSFVLGSLFVAFAVVAVLLAASGLYGVMAYAVGQRSAEIALRMALGASEGAIGRQMVGEGLRLTAVGVGVGVAGAAALARVMGSILVGVTPTDPVTYAGVVVVTLVAVLPAVVIPARRALRTDPIQSLKRA